MILTKFFTSKYDEHKIFVNPEMSFGEFKKYVFGQMCEFKKQKEENEEKIQEILEVQGIDENYNTEKLSLESMYYISDNNSIKILILSLILILISIILIFKIRNNKK